MFELGHYRFVTIEGGIEGSWSDEVIEVQMPLIKLAGLGKPKILNTGASTFVSAEREIGGPASLKINLPDELPIPDIGAV